MSNACPKVRVLRLRSEEYADLRDAVLRRDDWRCQFCGSKVSLQVHHQQFRSRSGEDKPDNLITLCASCHTDLHHVGQKHGLAARSNINRKKL